LLDERSIDRSLNIVNWSAYPLFALTPLNVALKANIDYIKAGGEASSRRQLLLRGIGAKEDANDSGNRQKKKTPSLLRQQNKFSDRFLAIDT
jgi:hypothetical protein